MVTGELRELLGPALILTMRGLRLTAVVTAQLIAAKNFLAVTRRNPPPTEPNGFLALARYDRPQSDGNSDGWIDDQDLVFESLRLWIDDNRNGISEPNELHTLASKGVARVELDYRESRRVDGHGNQFKYRTKVRNVRGEQLGRWAWDVILVTSP